MNKVEEYAGRIHETALKEGEKYAKEHGHSPIEEVAYGRGFKAGAMTGYKQALEDILNKYHYTDTCSDRMCGMMWGIESTLNQLNNTTNE